MSNQTKIISLNITKFPQNLMIPEGNNDVSLQVINNSNKNEKFHFAFEGENLTISVTSENLTNAIDFTPGETKNIDLRLNPTADGFGKLIINVFWLKIVEYTVKVQKVRETVPKSKSNKILDKKSIKIPETIDVLNPEDFTISMSFKDIEQAENELRVMQESYKSSNLDSTSKITIKDIDSHIKKLAKGYIAVQNPHRALELALQLSDPSDQISFYYNLVRTYALKNLNEILQLVNNLNDLNTQQRIYRLLALDQVSSNPEQAIRIAFLIGDESVQESVLITIIGKTTELDPILAIKLTEYIKDQLLKVKLLFNIARKLHKKNNQAELIKIIKKIIETLLVSLESSLREKKTRKLVTDFFENALRILAEILNPKEADLIIEGISNQEFKEGITKDLFDVIYVLVDEVRTKVESEVIFSQYYLLNTYTSNINNSIKNFSLTGGNISNNLLSGDFDFNIAILSLFSFNFSIFPLIDRVYSDLKLNSKKSIAYYIYPSKENYNENESAVLKNTLIQFFRNFTNIPSPLYIFNLDFIPYLGKPTVIISSEPELIQILNSKIKRMGDIVNLIIDDSMFKGGKIYDTLTQIFPSHQCKIINLLLSYEFINDYNIFKTFIESLL
ncbi:MAG: hypothetical protein ACFFB0_06420 [Promethearchaeota archaeon]